MLVSKGAVARLLGRDGGRSLLIAGALAAWVPPAVWTALFVPGHGWVTELVGALVGPLVAMLSFVSSVGNVPPAAVLWRWGISFAGVIAFIFGDLLVIRILDIYRKYYRGRVALYLFAVSYVAMVVAGLAVGAVFTITGAVTSQRVVAVGGAPITWDATTAANIAALGVCAVLLFRFVRTGGVAMLRHMNATPTSLSDAVAAPHPPG